MKHHVAYNPSPGLSRDHRTIALHGKRLRTERDAPTQLYADLADRYHKGAELERGRSFFDELAVLQPDRAAALLGRALLEIYTGDTARAWEVLRQAQEREPSSPDVIGLMIHHASTPARRAELRSILAKLETSSEAPAEMPIWLGVMAMQEGRLDEAEEVLREALARRPEDPGILLNLGVLYRDTGRTTKALTTFQELTESDPDAGLAWFNLAITEAGMGRMESAQEHLERAIAAGERSPPVLNLLARIVARQGDGERAVRLLEGSIAVKPDQPEIQALLESLRESQGR